MGISNKTNLIIIASGKPKIWDKFPDIGPVKASDVYTGTFHRLSKAYAEQFAKEYLILSPKYGFLRPDDIVPKTYDVRFTMKGTGADTIQLEELKAQWQKLQINPTEQIPMLGGKKFRGLLASITDDKQSFCFPLEGATGIGVMQRELKQSVETGMPLNRAEK
ncbi:hypothetical protein QJV15_05390 [Listeria cossartiae subsp. cayugensis]|uniref:DUF6884 domain-containing protein n=1 Tax=Listeria TaxID=1637 RepID=UPI00287FFF2E|nr:MULTISPECIES: DUF6884 domain-containing protein [Listeria]MDT0000300.1 hypothetical protein [Listeria cossartiae subsp. cayugensis]MDT0008612.1 hypothetical protein [Listeria cossartiae subsp. cayugensis]MDT0030444.1 hypothetical protein [Listeria cossartiae subsp. cayugensis]MDT0038446.1 hypothetical protein [Listeria cossartiae subsp. cayugensis]MDT0043797.1 hypothetical protein [Listeria cossartiae subsp. cayugensis]